MNNKQRAYYIEICDGDGNTMGFKGNESSYNKWKQQQYFEPKEDSTITFFDFKQLEFARFLNKTQKEDVNVKVVVNSPEAFFDLKQS